MQKLIPANIKYAKHTIFRKNVSKINMGLLSKRTSLRIEKKIYEIYMPKVSFAKILSQTSYMGNNNCKLIYTIIKYAILNNSNNLSHSRIYKHVGFLVI